MATTQPKSILHDFLKLFSKKYLILLICSFPIIATFYILDKRMKNHQCIILIFSILQFYQIADVGEIKLSNLHHIVLVRAFS